MLDDEIVLPNELGRMDLTVFPLTAESVVSSLRVCSVLKVTEKMDKSIIIVNSYIF